MTSLHTLWGVFKRRALRVVGVLLAFVIPYWMGFLTAHYTAPPITVPCSASVPASHPASHTDVVIWVPDERAFNDGAFNDGANQALEHIMLLDLANKMNEKRQTWGEMIDTVREQMHVAPPESP